MSGISLTNNNQGFTPVDPDIEFVQGNDGVNVGPNPTTHIIKLLADTSQGVDTSGNAVTYEETITMFDATEAQKGVVLLASNAETLLGTDTDKAITPDDLAAKIGVQTLHGLPYGGGAGGVFGWLGEATDGQIPIGDTGGIPILGNITCLDNTLTVTNGPGTIDLSNVPSFTGSGSTIGAVTTNLITIPLGAVAGTFQIQGRIKGFEATGPAGCGYEIYGTFITDGATATFVGDDDLFSESVSLVPADGYFIASGNNAILQVLGVALLTIDWEARAFIF